jgi:aspartate racemase
MTAAELVADGSEADFALSFAQERLWFLDRLQPSSTAYRLAARRTLRGALEVTALTQALHDLVQRHESLRTIFPDSGGAPVQRICPPEPVLLEIIDLEPGPATAQSAAAWRIIQAHAAGPFDLARGPLFRPLLIRYGPDDQELCIVIHHIVADGWSLGVLVRDLTTLYEARLAGRPPTLPELPIRYVDFALWQRRRLTGDVLEVHRRYWRERLGALPTPLPLPTDHPRTGPPAADGASHDFVVPRQLADGLRALSRRENTTLFMTLLAVFTVLLARSSGQDDIVVGTPVASRSHVELEPLIGLFVNTLVLRTDLADDPSFQELLARVRETCLGAHAHADMPFEKLVEELQPERVLGQNPIFQISFVWQDAIAGGDVAFVTVATPFDLTLFIRDVADGTLSATLQYRRDLFEPATMARLAGHYGTLLESAVAEPARRISDLRLLSDAESHQLLVEWNATAAPYPRDRSVHGLFEDQVDATPDAIALVFGDAALTYRELDARANRLARHLRAAGVAAERRVGVLMDRSMEMIVALLAILKAGGAYVPLERLAPPERLAFMLGDTKTGVVLTQTRMLSRLPASGTLAIPLDAEWAALGDRPATRLDSAASADDLAYVIYTSGSTGEPKGVAVTHRNVVRLVKGTSYAHFGPDEVVLQLTALSFDVATFEIWGALLNGGRLVMAPPAVPSIEELGALLARHRVTTLWLTAGLFEQVVDHRVESLRPLRQLLAGGDVVSPPHVRRVLSALPAVTFINGYGPTESTTFACCHTVTSAPSLGHSVPIGRPIANTRVYVLDRRRQPVPIGVAGELWIAGDGLARGYIGRPELTAERFVVQALSPTLEERLYRSGDLVRWLGDGTIEFIGRLDDQVKIRGFRVEPGEIEAALARHPRVQSATVVTRRAPGGKAHLVGYVVGAAPLDLQELREFLQRTLPPYMIPAAFVSLDRLPLGTSGKVDRRALPEPEASPERGPLVEPRDELERRLAAIWSDVLSIDRVGIRDSFFDLGGHSLLAIRMVARTEEALGIVLPLATLFEVSTIEGVAAVIRRGLHPASGRSLVAIQAAGSRPPLFVVPGIGGTVLGYHRLARLLGSDQPLYGLQSRGLDGRERPLTRIEDIASAFLREIREVQPAGPYHLVGMCMGGVVAYEMAQQLQAAGETVEFLGLLETWPPETASMLPPPRATRASVMLGFVARRLRLHVEALRRRRGRERLRYLGGGVKLLADIVAKRDLLRGARNELFRDAVIQANTLAFRRYVPRAYPGAIVLVCAEGRSVAPIADRRLAWLDLALGGHEVHSAPGDDSGLMLTEPHVRTLATQLTACLARAQISASRPG